MSDTLNIENIGHKFTEIVESEQWKELQEKYNYCNDIFVLGHGGNMAIADHTAVDMSRLSNGTKNAMCPGSCVVATSLINDTNFDQWMVSWLKQMTSTRTKSQMDKSGVDEGIISKNEAIILSMTKKERENPKIINGSRRKRIANGSGTDVATINKLLKQFKLMSDMMKKMSKGNLNKNMSDGIPPELFNQLK